MNKESKLDKILDHFKICWVITAFWLCKRIVYLFIINVYEDVHWLMDMIYAIALNFLRKIHTHTHPMKETAKEIDGEGERNVKANGTKC